MNSFSPDGFKGSTFSLALAGLAVRAFAAARKAVRSRIEVARLADLDDRALKDIGLLRTDVAAALAVPYYRDPSAHLIDVAGHKRAASGVKRPTEVEGSLSVGARLRRPDAVLTVPAVKPACC